MGWCWDEKSGFPYFFLTFFRGWKLLGADHVYVLLGVLGVAGEGHCAW